MSTMTPTWIDSLQETQPLPVLHQERKVEPPPWLQSLPLPQTRSHRTIYVHLDQYASRIDLLECALLAHRAIPQQIRISAFNFIILALVGLHSFYRSQGRDIALVVDKGLLDEVVICEGVQQPLLQGGKEREP